MNRKRAQLGTLVSPCKSTRAMTALMIAVLLVAGAQTDLCAQQTAPAYVELGAEQLDQLVAPIALYPDSLVGQVLTASTYPDQIAAADAWLNQNMGLPPDQRAAAADGMPWDPAVKALTAFPSVLDNLAKNNAWASQLGNAYYNQPGDVMNAVQALRTQAHDSNQLATTAQQRVVVEAGVISIMPVAAEVVYVPYYNPWVIWGPMFVAYPGFVAIAPPPGIVVGVGVAFFPAVPIGFYAGFDWGFAAWTPVWGGGVIAFHHETYISNSVTVINHGQFGRHDRGAFERGGRGVPSGYHAAAHAGAARSAAANTRSANGNGTARARSSMAGGVQARSSGFSGAGAAAQPRSSFSSHLNNGPQARNSFSSQRTNGGPQSRSNFASFSKSNSQTTSQARSSFSSSRTISGTQARNNFSSRAGSGMQARNNFSSRMGGGTQVRNNFSSRAGGGMQARNNSSSRMGGGMQARNNFSSRAGGGMQARNNSSSRMGGGMQARNSFSSRVGGGVQARNNSSSRMGGGMQARNNFSTARMGGGGARTGGGGWRR
jgi:hypothetical protein